jgi:hypothetical protein
MTKIKIGIVSAIAVAALAAPMMMQHQSLAKLREENQALQQKVSQLSPLQDENQRLSNLVVQAKTRQSFTEEEVRDLARLRDEVGRLRQQTNEMAASRRKQTAKAEGKRLFHNTSMAEFAKYVGAVLQAPVADQTGLPGTYEIELTPLQLSGPSENVETMTGVGHDPALSGLPQNQSVTLPTSWVGGVASALLQELGVQLIPFGGPFTNNEEMFARDIPGVMRRKQLEDGSWGPRAVPRPDATNIGFAIKLDHLDAQGLKASTDTPPIAAPAATLFDANTPGLAPAIADKLRSLDTAKTLWESRRNGEKTSGPTWEELRPFFGHGTDDDVATLTNSPDGIYIIGASGQLAQFASQLKQNRDIVR